MLLFLIFESGSLNGDNTNRSIIRFGHSLAILVNTSHVLVAMSKLTICSLLQHVFIPDFILVSFMDDSHFVDITLIIRTNMQLGV